MLRNEEDLVFGERVCKLLIIVLILALTGINQASQSASLTSYAGNAYSGTVEGIPGIARLTSPYSIVKTPDGKVISINLGHNISLIETDGSISLLAGDIVAGDVDGLATGARFNSPRFGAFDSQGNLYVTDYNNHKIKKININTGEVVTYAGSTAGYLDGARLSAQFRNPTGIVIDSDDNIYVSDFTNRRIRQISSDGIVTTIAGSGTAGWLDGLATSARFNQPQGLAIGVNGDLYLADAANRRIRRIYNDAGNWMVTTIAGTGVAGDVVGDALSSTFSNPLSVCFVAGNKLLIADSGNQKVKLLDLDSNIVSELAGSENGYRDGPAQDAMLGTFAGMLSLDDDSVLIADYTNHQIKHLSLNTVYQKPVINTIAGRNLSGNTNGKFGVNRLNTPRGMVKDSHGNIFFADSSNHRIKKIDSNGDVSVFAGSVSGLQDDQGEEARFHTPTGLAIDADDNIYVADWGNHRIRKITPGGLVTSYAGSSLGFTDGSSNLAQFRNPRGLAIDHSGNLYVADYGNHSVRRIDSLGNVITVSGTGVAGLVDGLGSNARHHNPFDLVLDNNGGIYVSDYTNHAIRKLHLEDGLWVTSTVAGGIGLGNKDGQGLTALFNSPAGLEYLDGYLYVVDRNNQCIRIIDQNDNVMTLAGTGFSGFADSGQFEASFANPEYIFIESSTRALVADSANHRIREIDLSRINIPSVPGQGSVDNGLKVSTYTGFSGVANFRDGNTKTAFFRNPHGMIYDAENNLYVADRGNHRIRKITPSGVVTTYAGSTAGLLDGKRIASLFRNPTDMVFDSQGNMFVTDYGNHVIRKITPSGDVSIFAGTSVAGFNDGPGLVAQFNGPFGIAVDSFDNLYVTDYNNSRIRKITPDAEVTTLTGSAHGFRDGHISLARFNRPQGITINSNDEIFVADYNNHRIRKISNSVVSTIAGHGNAGFKDGAGAQSLFHHPSFIILDNQGNLLVSDMTNNRIRKIDSNNEVTTIAGLGIQGFKDADANKALFHLPRGLAINSTEDILVAEDSHRIRLISEKEVIAPPPPIVINPGNSAPVIEMLTELQLDANNTIAIRIGVNLDLRVFVYDFEDGLAVRNNLRWDSNVDGLISSGDTRLNTARLSSGLHLITATVRDSGGLETSLSFSIQVFGLGEDVDGARQIIEQQNRDRLVKITLPNKKSFVRRQGRLRAVAFNFDNFNNITADLRRDILWEIERQGSETGLRQFLGQGGVLRLNRIRRKGVYNLYARVGDTENTVKIRVNKQRVMILDN
jgi:sugar lactone lactonase YvrE